MIIINNASKFEWEVIEIKPTQIRVKRIINGVLNRMWIGEDSLYKNWEDKDGNKCKLP